MSLWARSFNFETGVLGAIYFAYGPHKLSSGLILGKANTTTSEFFLPIIFGLKFTDLF